MKCKHKIRSPTNFPKRGKRQTIMLQYLRFGLFFFTLSSLDSTIEYRKPPTLSSDLLNEITPTIDELQEKVNKGNESLSQGSKEHCILLDATNKFVNTKVYHSLEYWGVCSKNIFGNKRRQVFDEMTDF